ncbi:hypothetical protein JKP88DRAFT_270878 [Tribonema minus]|uniref:Uncharacterized protein n=1 Tax=Tribonema minus TaxID=303371 RepID=A0A835YIP3_9STRA|nr:hypothetical protein JKP88DRAFT_270878 [Tribonema minus]
MLLNVLEVLTSPWLLGALALPTVLWIVLYFGPLLATMVLPAQNLKKKYGAEWALVTGGSSGIGRALVEALALQGFNVVIVALGGGLLDETHAALSAAFKDQKFVKVGVNFAPGVDYMTPIKEATDGLPIQCIFNNAGYIVTGFYDSTLGAKQAANMECNAVAAARITHHFLGRLIAARLRGCVVFTSSAVAYMPAPFCVMYGATKAFLTNFAGSLAAEVRCKGVDVLSIHPSPVATAFYSGLDHRIDMMDKAARGAVAASTLPKVIFKSVGRVVWREVGAPAVIMRLSASLLPGNFLYWSSAVAAPFLPDYKTHDVNRGRKE